MTVDIDFQFVDTNGITLHTAVAGPEDGPLAVLLHGFPEFWYGWKNQIEPLVNAGYRVVVPDQRGYNLSEKPKGVKNYTIDKLRDDITGIIEAFGKNKAVIAGHDWGGAVAWYLTATKPEYVDKLIAINIPHPGAMEKTMRRYPPQWLKSSYMLFFQIPKVPESLFATDGYKQMCEALKASSQPGTFSATDLERYTEAWSQTGSLEAMLNWYRAIWYADIPKDKISVKTKIIWGVGDQFLSTETAKTSLDFLTDGDLVFVGEATHWVNHEQPDIVNRHILDFLK